MLVTDILNESVETLDSTARQLGIQIYHNACKVAYEQGKPNQSTKFAITMANRFYSEILKTIDEEAKYQNAKQI